MGHINKWYITLVLILYSIEVVISVETTTQKASTIHIPTTGTPTIINKNEHGKYIAEVNEGGTAILQCLSNDVNHTFLFWQFKEDVIIGPANNITDKKKYQYELTNGGELFIRHINENDAGDYKCFSREIKSQASYVKSIELIVKKDWEEVWENDSSTNLLRGLLVFIVVAVIAGIIIVVYRMRNNGYVRDDFSDEDLGVDEVREGPYNTTTQRASTIDDTLNMSLVDTELPRALNSMYTDRL